MKKVAYGVLPLLILSGAFIIDSQAQTPSHPPSNQWRIGVGLAGEYNSIDAKMKDNFSPFGINFQSDRNQTKKQFQVSPSFELGFTFAEHLYIGLFLSGHFSDSKTKSRAWLKNLTFFSHEFEMKHYVDILAKAGCKLTPNTMIYGLIGPSIAKWSHTTAQLQQGRQSDSFDINKRSVGLGLGFGIEYLMKEHYAFSIDFIHHIHKGTSRKKTMTFIDNIGGPVRRTGEVSKRIQPSYSTIAVRVSYFL